jgi:RNA polymerase sigma factor (sigma-70 family)
VEAKNPLEGMRDRKVKRERMIEQGCDLRQSICSVADRAIQRYARGILTVEVLTEQMMQEWEARSIEESKLSQALLTRIAQRICSRELYVAWRSPEQELRNFAFDNIKRYLENSLRQVQYAKPLGLHANVLEDVLQQTLSNLCLALNRNPPAGPNDPAAFLKWMQTILIREAYSFSQKAQSEPCVSLDVQPEAFFDQLVNEHNGDPQEQVLQLELQQTLKNAILSLRNPRYRLVLVCTYLAGMDESELANCLQVQVQEVYLWRHRALKALRSKPEVMQALRPWLQ